MKKLLRNICLVLLPIVLYYCVFIAFEPNNYFGLKENADGTDIMAILRMYEDTPGDSIILGDSRMAKFDAQLIEDITGDEYTNLAFGGASLKEQLDILEWAYQQNPQLNEVVFGLSFYTLNQSYNHDRKVIDALGNPFAYMTNLGYNINMLTNLYDHLAPSRSVGSSGETMEISEYEYVPYVDFASGETVEMREKIAEHITNLLPRTIGWQLNEEEFLRMISVMEGLMAEGVKVTIVLPPAHDDVMEYVVKSCGIDVQMEPVLEEMNSFGAGVLDYEFNNRDILRDDQYFDGFHIDEERGLDDFTTILFSDIMKNSGDA